MIKPLGNLVLIKAKKIESMSSGGIILPDDLTQKEQAVECTGTVVAFGPTAFKRWKGCESPRWCEKAINFGKEAKLDGSYINALCDYWKWEDPDYPAHKQWGIQVGDVVEHRRHNHKDSVFEADDGEIYRYVPDIEILGKIEEDS